MPPDLAPASQTNRASTPSGDGDSDGHSLAGVQHRPDELVRGKHWPGPSQRRHPDLSRRDVWLFCKTNAHPLPLLVTQQQEERGVPERSQYQMPYFALNPQLPYSEDCSATCLTAERSNHLSITKLKLLPSQTISVNSNFDMNQKQRFLCLQRALNVKKLHRVYFKKVFRVSEICLNH